MSIKMDSSSVCSSIPSSSSLGPKKRGFSRLSFRRLFYANPFLNQQRLASRRKRSSNATTTSVADIEVSADASVSSHTAGAEASYVPKRRESGTGANIVTSQPSENVEHSYLSSQIITAKSNGDRLLECPLCLSEMPVECFPQISSCPHRSCFDCLKQYLRIEITESRVNISCPECTEPLHPNDLRMILNNEILMGKYEDFMLRRVLVSEPDARWCPAPDCSYAVIAAGCASCPKLRCERPGCNTFFCYHCKQEWHPNQTCDAARAQRSPNVRSSSVSFTQDSSAQRDDIKPCPRCQVLIVKMDDGSCNHMTCAVCGAEFCWLCMKEISDLHYLSPSGCTFWGKKPWSRKKKILWQLGTLVGAPVGIGLVAGIAVPAMIIGIPVWVGRKLHARFEHASKHKRNLAITGGVTASILVSPILAGLAVGIGVPILLAYVYGVVPISLCRSGGCGVTTSASGVRIEFDDENDLALGGSGQVPGDTQSVDTSSHRVANPSIGEVSFGMSASLSMGSGSHLERIGLIRDSDRESASNTAIAGASLTGSIISSMTGGATTSHRLEVQADVQSNKRFSFSSETASVTVSLSERSATFSVADDASTKALAGSVLSYRERDGSSTSCTPVEIHMDPSVPVREALDGGYVVGMSHGPLYSEHDELYLQARGEPGSTNEDTSAGGVAACCQNPLDVRGKSSKQVNLNMREEHYTYRSPYEDSVSEKVRFDDNVSFIDDPPLEEVRVADYESYHESSDRRDRHRPYLVSSTSWHEGTYFRGAESRSSMASSSYCQHTVEAIAEINFVGNSQPLPTADRPVKSVLARRAQKTDAGGGATSKHRTTEDVYASENVPSNEDVKSDVNSVVCSSGEGGHVDCSQLSLPLDTDLDQYRAVAWATHQSMPCILDTEQTFYAVAADLKQV